MCCASIFSFFVVRQPTLVCLLRLRRNAECHRTPLECDDRNTYIERSVEDVSDIPTIAMILSHRHNHHKRRLFELGAWLFGGILVSFALAALASLVGGARLAWPVAVLLVLVLAALH